MYVLHFYSASHHDGLMEELDTGWSQGLPVFISECGICESTGDGDIDFASAARWFAYVNEQVSGFSRCFISSKDQKYPEN